MTKQISDPPLYLFLQIALLTVQPFETLFQAFGVLVSSVGQAYLVNGVLGNRGGALSLDYTVTERRPVPALVVVVRKKLRMWGLIWEESL